MIRIRAFLGLLYLTAFVGLVHAKATVDALPAIDVALGDARACTQGNTLIVSNQWIRRAWEWTGKGFATRSLRDVQTGHEWARAQNCEDSDWTFPGATASPTARLLSLAAKPSDDHHFTSEMLQVVAELFYPELRLTNRFTIWIYPGGPGIRTQHWLSGDARTNAATADTPALTRVDYLPLTFSNAFAVGYYTGTEWRDKAEDHLIRAEQVGLTNVDWASVLSTEDGTGGVLLVKESHKCVNQTGIGTGAFELAANGTSVTGCGLPLTNVVHSAFQWCWATWTLVYNGPGEDARSLALKRFDRLRYPIDPALDVYAKANTWGSGGKPLLRASEAEVLAEIDSVADLGLDALQIDDGWQTRRMPGKHQPQAEWFPRSDWYPQGWSNVVAKARQRDIKLGIWIAYGSALNAMKWNYDHGGFTTWKFDFAKLKNYRAVRDYLDQSRALVDYTGHKIRINFDVTELPPRVGYFWARECGSIWLENREPQSGTYAFIDAIPWLILRDTWELARYLNNNKFELPVENFRAVCTNKSDASLYSQTYAVALGFSGLPVFFQTTRLLVPEDRAEIREFLGIYKKHRKQMFLDFVFPLGEEPSNASWSGFQWVEPKSKEGYLLVFRERLNAEAKRPLALHFLHPGATLELENLRTGAHSQTILDARNRLELSIAKPGDILFLKYQAQ